MSPSSNERRFQPVSIVLSKGRMILANSGEASSRDQPHLVSIRKHD